MTKDEIQAEWDAFIDYPEGSGKLYVTTTSALIFARTIAEMVSQRCAQAAQPSQPAQNHVWIVHNKVASMYFWSEDAARKAATFSGSLCMDVARIDLLDVAAQPSHALNWSELVAWWESGAEQWEGLRDIVSRMVAHAHAIDTSPERVEKREGNVQVAGWRTIESAPKDMASRLYRVNGFCVQGFVDAAGILCAQNDRQAWRNMHGKPTHWMPLPAAPSTKEKTE